MKIRFIPGYIAFILLVTACKKENNPGIPTVPKNQLIVALNAQYMDGSKLDSALAVWNVNGRQTIVKMALGHDSLLADLDAFQEGDGHLTLQLYSTIKFENQYSSQWLQEKDLSLKHNRSVAFDGPSGFKDANWLPRVQLRDGIGHLAVVGLRPEDPFFQVINVPAGVLQLVVSREYWHTKSGPVKVGGGEFQCSGGCKNSEGDVINNTFFHFLPQQVGTKTWNHIEIVILYIEDKNGGGFVLSMTHDIE